MFAVPAEQVPLLLHGCALKLAPGERKRLVGYLEGQDLARDGEAWVRRVSDATVEAIARRGEAAAMELREDVPELKLTLEFGKGKTWGGKVGVSTRVLFLLACEGRIIRAGPRGSWISGQYRWTTAAGRIPGGIPDLDPAEARAEILELWLRTYGPGTTADLRWWSGWPLRDVRAALESLDVSEVETDEGLAFVLTGDLETNPTIPSPERPCCRRSTPPSWDGGTGTGTWVTTPGPSTTATGTPDRPSGGTAGWWAGGPRPSGATSLTASSKTSVARERPM